MVGALFIHLGRKLENVPVIKFFKKGACRGKGRENSLRISVEANVLRQSDLFSEMNVYYFKGQEKHVYPFCIWMRKGLFSFKPYIV